MRHQAPRPHQDGRPAFVAFPESAVEQSVPARFRSQLARDPERLAVKTADQAQSYAQLNRWANRVARTLIERSGGDPEPVVVCFDNSAAHLASLLGVLKAGKFYVVLDPAMPAARKAYIVEDSGAALALTDGEHAPAVADIGIAPEQVIDIEQLDPGLPDHDLELDIAPDALAYILYTSGSTGRPKGVMQTHRYVLNLTRAYTNSGLIQAQDRFALLSSPIFAGAVRDTYCALLNGATLFPFRAKAEGLTQLADWLMAERISLLFMVPTAFRHFCHLLAGHERFPHLRQILLVSETIYKRDVDLYKQHFSDDCVLAATLGASELSPVCQYFVDKQTEIPNKIVPIGYPPDHAQIELLDEQGRAVPTGEVGEIVVRSRYLSQGYWKRPELTAAVYSEVPGGEGVRQFRTGDLGRMTADGCITHVGRKDFQVQIRGYRIETGEVETALLETGLVREAVVLALPDHVDELQLVAYVVPSSPDTRPTLRELRGLLAETLPDYMLPADLVPMESFPQTPSGKIKRRALPHPSELRASEQRSVTAPRDDVERALVTLWSEVLGRADIDVHDDFFEIGGHSLFASQVIARLRDTLDIELPMTVFFDSPSVAALARWISDARDAGRGAVIHVPGPAELAVERGPGDPRFPIALSQLRLWVLEQLAGDSAAYNVARAFRLEGALDVALLEQAVQAIVKRHESLRTRFDASGAQPEQVVARSQPTAVAREDLSGLPDGEREPAARALLTRALRRPFDLAQGPLLRVLLIKEGQERWTLLVMMHHLISDDWSVQVFQQELSALYAAAVAGSPPELPALAYQYADHAAWHRERVASGALDEQLAHWTERLAGASFEIDLPRDRPRAATGEHRGAIEPFQLHTGVVSRLAEVGRAAGATQFMTLLSVFAALLSRCSGRDELVIGTPIANRNPPDSEALIGFFVNTLALRLAPGSEPSFRDLLAHVREVALDAYSHADVPFDRVVQALPLDRQRGSGPLFQAMFVLQNVPKQELTLPGMRAERLELGKPTAGSTFDLMLSLTEDAGELRGAFEYDANLFDAASVRRLVRHFEALTAAAVQDPDQAISRLPMLTPDEREQLLGPWAGRASAYPRERCVHELFAEQAARAPDAVAAVFEGQQLSYAELDRRANQLAHELRARGVGPEVMVALCVERSLEMLVGILAILKAGGAYVPLDPAYPAARLAFMLEDTRAPVLLTQAALLPTLPAFEGGVLCLDRDAPAFAARPDHAPESGATPRSLAYVIYTSGSTGRPKGVCVEHRSVVRLVRDTDYVELGPQETLLQFAPISFDASTFELWGSLLNGARLVVFPPGAPSLEQLGRFIEDQGITTMWLTSALFQQMVNLQLERLAGVRQLLAGGETLPVPHVEKAIAALGDRRLINGYGPTENTTFTCCHVMTRDSVMGRTVPIGRPIANTRVYVLDRHMQPTPVGVPGELYIGGDGLARGYLNLPELTDERFVPDPFGAQDDGRLYRTGDQARFLPDGSVEFLGRGDGQVKVRGHRIELGEIEVALLRAPGVREAAVIVREDTPGDRRLSAYVVAAEGAEPAADELRRLLLASLPAYMVPNAFVTLEALPLTPNGKLDPAALPAPTERALGTEAVAPRNETETRLAAIWRELLKLDAVGVCDDFFELGGHSLLGMQLISRVRDEFGCSVPLPTLFGDPTIEGLAAALDTILAVRAVGGAAAGGPEPGSGDGPGSGPGSRPNDDPDHSPSDGPGDGPGDGMVEFDL